MAKCDCCNSPTILYSIPNSDRSVCLKCLGEILEESMPFKLIEEIKVLRTQNETLEQENLKLRSVLCGDAKKF